MFFLHACKCAKCVAGAHGGQERVLGHLGLELEVETVVRLHVCSGK